MEYTAFLIGSAVYKINLVFPKWTPFIERVTKIVTIKADDKEIDLRVTFPALWELSQVPMVNQWELNDRLIEQKLVDSDARISTSALPVGQTPHYVTNLTKSVNSFPSNHSNVLDDIDESDLPSDTLEEQIDSEEDEDDILDDGVAHTKSLGAG